jgi:hypothetical protein
MICLKPESIKAHLILIKGDPKAMHPMSICVWRSNDQTISQLQKVLIKTHHLQGEPP